MEWRCMDKEMAFNFDNGAWSERRPFAFKIAGDLCAECLSGSNPFRRWIDLRRNQSQQPAGFGSGCVWCPHAVSSYRDEPLVAVESIPEQVVDMPQLATCAEPD